jgi:site-specific DNA-cytosine methylase
VVGFETSEMRGVLRETLHGMGFTTREHILSPRQFGVPYSRPRYFLLAKRAPLRWVDDGDAAAGVAAGGAVVGGDGGGGGEEGLRRIPPPSKLSTPSEWVPAGGLSLLREVDPVEATVPRVKPRAGGVGEGGGGGGGDGDGDIDEAAPAPAVPAAAPEEKEGGEVDDESAGGPERAVYGVAPLSCFMENQSENDVWSEYGVTQADVYKSLAAIDVVLATDHKCNCFTKSYGKYVKGTGSFVANRAVVKGQWDGTVVNGGGKEKEVDGGKEKEKENGAGAGEPGAGEVGGEGEGVMLRYFTEREVANIHSFPPEFSFPQHITRGQRYALLGNSLSVACVAPLIDYLLTDA